jgi:hypothetical protein
MMPVSKSRTDFINAAEHMVTQIITIQDGKKLH